jgi:hypothetical protein
MFRERMRSSPSLSSDVRNSVFFQREQIIRRANLSAVMESS